jgi:hypothetical protein
MRHTKQKAKTKITIAKTMAATAIAKAASKSSLFYFKSRTKVATTTIIRTRAATLVMKTPAAQ